MYYTFNIEQQIQSIMIKCQLSDFEKPAATTNELCDITDGELYKKYWLLLMVPCSKKYWHLVFL